MAWTTADRRRSHASLRRPRRESASTTSLSLNLEVAESVLRSVNIPAEQHLHGCFLHDPHEYEHALRTCIPWQLLEPPLERWLRTSCIHGPHRRSSLGGISASKGERTAYNSPPPMICCISSFQSAPTISSASSIMVYLYIYISE